MGLRNSPAWDHSFRIAAPGEIRSERPNHFHPAANHASPFVLCHSLQHL
jgi:hypothetical protein